MPATNDCKLSALRTRTTRTDGTINDLELVYVQNLITATPKAQNINDAWHQYWDQLTIPGGAYNDRAYTWLKGLNGAVGDSLTDLWYWFWCTNTGNPTPPALEPAEPDMDLMTLCLQGEGWPATYDGADTITITLPAGTVEINRTFLLACDFTSLPDPIENDVENCMQAQNYCL